MRMPLPRVLRVALAASTMLLALPAAAAIVIKVAAAHFPPYSVHPESGSDDGLLPHLVEDLNKVQGDYTFVLVPTSIPRRFRDFADGRVDMAIFENPAWGWEKIPHVSVDMGLEDAEVFVGKREEQRGQDYFADLSGKRLALFSGYHYAFADFNADRQYLAEHYNASLTYSHDSNLMMVLRDRADIALVTRSYLYDYLSRHPDAAAQLMVSDRIDQVYHHYALIRPKAPIRGEQFNEYLLRLRANGDLLNVFAPYRIAVRPLPVQTTAIHTAP